MLELMQCAAGELGITVALGNGGTNEVGTVAAVNGENAKCNVGDVIVRIDPRHFRPTEVEALHGDARGRAQVGADTGDDAGRNGKRDDRRAYMAAKWQR